MSIKSSCSEHGHMSSKAAVRSWSRAAAFSRNFRVWKIYRMMLAHNYEQRQGGSDVKEIGGRSQPAKRQNCEGFYCESAQFFGICAAENARGCHWRSCFLYAGCSFSVGENGECTIGDFTLLNGPHHGRNKIDIGSHCSFMNAASPILFSSARAGATSSTAASRHFQRSPQRQNKNRAVISPKCLIGMNAHIEGGDRRIQSVAAGSVVTNRLRQTGCRGNPAV